MTRKKFFYFPSFVLIQSSKNNVSSMLLIIERYRSSTDFNFFFLIILFSKRVSKLITRYKFNAIIFCKLITRFQCLRSRLETSIPLIDSIRSRSWKERHFCKRMHRVNRNRVGSSGIRGGRDARQRRFSRDPLAADKRRPIYEQREKRNFFKLGLK